MSNAVIRMIETKDFEDIHNLNNELGYTYDKEKVYKKIISLLEAGNDIILVAEKDGHVIGYAHGAPYETADEESIANDLYDAFEERAKRNGYKGMRLSLDQSRSKAHELFLKHGFQTKRSLYHCIKYFD